MRRVNRSVSLVMLVAALAGCGDLEPDSEPFAQTTQAINICNETVPENHFVDGIPAYAQCSTVQNSAIYSNNGIDTATSSQGSGWIRTQMAGGYQCTEFAHRYLRFKWNVTWLPNGDAGTWCNTAPPASSGVEKSTTPVHGDLIVFAPSACGSDATTGHVALVDIVNATSVTIVEENGPGRRNTAQSCATCFLHVIANNGSPGGAASGGATSGGSSGSRATSGASSSLGGALTSVGGNNPTASSARGGNSGVNSGGFGASSGGSASNSTRGMGGALTTSGTAMGGASNYGGASAASSKSSSFGGMLASSVAAPGTGGRGTQTSKTDAASGGQTGTQGEQTGGEGSTVLTKAIGGSAAIVTSSAAGGYDTQASDASTRGGSSAGLERTGATTATESVGATEASEAGCSCRVAGEAARARSINAWVAMALSLVGLLRRRRARTGQSSNP